MCLAIQVHEDAPVWRWRPMAWKTVIDGLENNWVSECLHVLGTTYEHHKYVKITSNFVEYDGLTSSDPTCLLLVIICCPFSACRQISLSWGMAGSWGCQTNGHGLSRAILLDVARWETSSLLSKAGPCFVHNCACFASSALAVAIFCLTCLQLLLMYDFISVRWWGSCTQSSRGIDICEQHTNIILQTSCSGGDI